MATMRESLMKLAEVAKPVPGDEQEFVAKHGMKIMDFQGKDSISQESPYDHILKNVAVIKKPGDPGKDDHGHDAPGESEAAYHLPESRDVKIAKLSEMMGKEDEEDEEEEDEDDEDEDEDKKKEVNEAKEVTGVKMHYHNPRTGEKFHEVHFSVPAAEKFRKQHEKSGFKLVKKEAQFSEDIEQLDEIGDTPKGVERLRNYAASDRSKVKIKDVIAAKRSTDPEKAIDNLAKRQQFRKKAQAKVNAADAAKNPKPKQEPKDWRDDVYPRDPKDPHGIKPKYHMDEEMRPLLPGQKKIAQDLLAKEMQKRKEDRAAKKQAGTMKLKEEDRREANDKAREERVATPRPTAPNTIEGMRHRLQVVKKQIIDKT